MINNITIIEMGTVKSFLYLIMSLRGKNFERYFASMIYSFRCLAKDNFDSNKYESNMSPKCFCSFTFNFDSYES